MWRDCTYSDSAFTAEQVAKEKLIEMQTIGFEIMENKTWLAVAMEYVDRQKVFRHVTWIPKVNIVRRAKI